MEGLITLENVGMGYGNGPDVIRDFNLHIKAGSFRFLTGPSGAGKSTLLRLLFLSLQPTRGVARLFGENINGLDVLSRARLRRRIGVVFQDFRLLTHLSIFENVALPLRAAGHARATYQTDVHDLLDWVGLKSRSNDFPETLSGGEKQRVAIARAVVAKPDLILADEPTGSVDPAMAKRLLRLFLELNRQGTTVMIATHDEDMIRSAKGNLIRLDRHHVADHER